MWRFVCVEAFPALEFQLGMAIQVQGNQAHFKSD